MSLLGSVEKKVFYRPDHTGIGSGSIAIIVTTSSASVSMLSLLGLCDHDNGSPPGRPQIMYV